jgi:hypothetical protein
MATTLLDAPGAASFLSFVQRVHVFRIFVDDITAVQRYLPALAADAGPAVQPAVVLAPGGAIEDGSLGTDRVGTLLVTLVSEVPDGKEGTTYDIVGRGRGVPNSRRGGKAGEGQAQEGEELHDEDALVESERWLDVRVGRVR